MKDIKIIEKLIREQINILEQIINFKNEVSDKLEFLFDRPIIENKQMESIEKSVKETITILTDETFWEWMEWFVYETDFGKRDDLCFYIDGEKYKPSMKNIFKQLLEVHVKY